MKTNRIKWNESMEYFSEGTKAKKAKKETVLKEIEEIKAEPIKEAAKPLESVKPEIPKEQPEKEPEKETKSQKIVYQCCEVGIPEIGPGEDCLGCKETIEVEIQKDIECDPADCDEKPIRVKRPEIKRYGYFTEN